MAEGGTIGSANTGAVAATPAVNTSVSAEAVTAPVGVETGRISSAQSMNTVDPMAGVAFEAVFAGVETGGIHMGMQTLATIADNIPTAEFATIETTKGAVINPNAASPQTEQQAPAALLREVLARKPEESADDQIKRLLAVIQNQQRVILELAQKMQSEEIKNDQKKKENLLAELLKALMAAMLSGSVGEVNTIATEAGA